MAEYRDSGVGAVPVSERHRASSSRSMTASEEKSMDTRGPADSVASTRTTDTTDTEASPASPPSPQTHMQVESKIELRVEWMTHVNKRLKELPSQVRMCFPDLTTLILKPLGKTLGKGMYGVVTDACLRGLSQTEDCDGWPLAIKKQQIYTKIELQSIRREVRAMSDANYLVQQRVCHNLPLLFASFICARPGEEQIPLPTYSTLVMEVADGTCQTLLQNMSRKYKLDALQNVVVDLSVQIFAVLLALGLNFDAIHNDLYTKNILVNEIDNE